MTDLQRRARQVIHLLGSLEDVLPAAPTWTGQLVRNSTLPGPAPSRSEACPECEGARITLDKFRRPQTCSTCKGRGRVDVDSYTNERVGTAQSALVLRTTTCRCDRCGGEGVWKFRRCELCDGTGRRSITRDADPGFARRRAEAGLDLWGSSGSYHELVRLLDELRVWQPRAHRLVWAVFVSRAALEEHLRDDEIMEIATALTWLAYRMPLEIIVPASARAKKHAPAKGRWANGFAQDRRDAEIRELAKKRPQQWIAQQFGLTPARVSQIVRAA